MIITAYNPIVDGYERSYLTSAISAGVAAVSVKNNDRFVINNRIMLGEMGRERSEIVTVTGAVTSGTALTVGTTVFSHDAEDPVIVMRFDQVKFYRSTTGESGAYSLLATVAMDVDNYDFKTKYDDTTGLATYYYKVSYYNSITAVESTLSDPIIGAGFGRSSVGFMIDEILREVSDENEQFTNRDEILGWFNEVNDDLLTRVRKPYGFLHTRTVKNRTAQDASGAGTVLAYPDDMWKFDFMRYTFVDPNVNPTTSTSYPVRAIPLQEFEQKYQNTLYSASSLENNDQLQFVALDDALSEFRLWPPSSTSSTGVFYIWYWKTFDELDSEANIFETPTPRIYKLYAMGKFYRKKGTQDSSLIAIADRYTTDYEKECIKLRRTHPKDAGSPRGFLPQPQDYKGNRQY